jgi:hypothetical protein
MISLNAATLPFSTAPELRVIYEGWRRGVLDEQADAALKSELGIKVDQVEVDTELTRALSR